MNNPFGQDVFSTSKNVLECHDRWIEDQGSFYQDSIYYPDKCYLETHMKFFYKNNYLKAITKKFENVFNMKLYPCIQIEFHRYLKNDFTDYHSDFDYDEEGFPNIRLIWIIQTAIKGGDLIFSTSNNDNSTFLESPRVNNFLVGFKTSKKSYHRVTPVIQGARLNIVLSFWSKSTFVGKNENTIYFKSLKP